MTEKEIKEVVEPSPKPVRLFVFWTGIIATVAYRIIIILNFYDPLWVKVSWYIGTVGFIIYFWHRYKIADKRADLARDYKLVDAVDGAGNIEPKQRVALHYLVETSLTSKSKWNSMVIFALSALALVIGIYLDFFSSL